MIVHCLISGHFLVEVSQPNGSLPLHPSMVPCHSFFKKGLRPNRHIPSCGSKLKGPSQRSNGEDGSQISRATSPSTQMVILEFGRSTASVKACQCPCRTFAPEVQGTSSASVQNILWVAPTAWMICTHHISSSSMHIFLRSFLHSFVCSFVQVCSFVHWFTPPFFRVSRPLSWPLPVAVINRQISGSDQLTFARASASTSTGVKPTSLTATSAWWMVAGLLKTSRQILYIQWFNVHFSICY